MPFADTHQRSDGCRLRPFDQRSRPAVSAVGAPPDLPEAASLHERSFDGARHFDRERSLSQNQSCANIPGIRMTRKPPDTPLGISSRADCALAFLASAWPSRVYGSPVRPLYFS